MILGPFEKITFFGPNPYKRHSKLIINFCAQRLASDQDIEVAPNIFDDF